ncbi:hypothetical protein [Flavobacterium sp.]|jgi:hypothetical protein|uniref:hypothetical protein n=1 Tax=Flavobacterium sp. TaxID=239 RepID=UPI002612530B|nr:hypothetical protein [Flavobacterium sp.]
MNIIELKSRQNISTDIKLSKIYSQFEELLSELKKKELPLNIIAAINKSVEQINFSTLTGTQLRKLVKQNQTTILKQIEKELKIVPKNHYLNLGTALGICLLGIIIGMFIGKLLYGLPIGMLIGIFIGSALDKKAFSEGRQLNLKI